MVGIPKEGNEQATRERETPLAWRQTNANEEGRILKYCQPSSHDNYSSSSVSTHDRPTCTTQVGLHGQFECNGAASLSKCLRTAHSEAAVAAIDGSIRKGRHFWHLALPIVGWNSFSFYLHAWTFLGLWFCCGAPFGVCDPLAFDPWARREQNLMEPFSSTLSCTLKDAR